MRKAATAAAFCGKVLRHGAHSKIAVASFGCTFMRVPPLSVRFGAIAER